MDQETGKLRHASLTPETIENLLSDRKTIAFLKAYLSIPDETVKTHLRRLVNELARVPSEPSGCIQG